MQSQTKLKGLNNTGNTCYLNSGTQMFLQNKDFCDKVHEMRSVHPEIAELNDFIKQYHSGGGGSITPKIVKEIIGNKFPAFRGNEQQDMQEMFNKLMDIINKYTNNAFCPIFQFKERQTMKCKLRTCLSKSITSVGNDFLTVPVVGSTLDDCYREYKVHERMDGDNKYACPKCLANITSSYSKEQLEDKQLMKSLEQEALRVGTRRIAITEWPKNLIVFLKRFETTRKNTTPIDIPVEWRHDYKLKGCVIHNGGLNGGHYFYISRIVKSNGSVHWYNCNDSNVSEINEDSALMHINKNGYIIYYEKDV